MEGWNSISNTKAYIKSGSLYQLNETLKLHDLIQAWKCVFIQILF